MLKNGHIPKYTHTHVYKKGKVMPLFNNIYIKLENR